MADAVGTQTETLLIRGLSAGVRVRDVARGELLTGVVIGLIVATAFLPFALIAWGDVRGCRRGLALLASCSVATIVAMTLPAIFQRLGRDPAFGSGPLATVFQDLASIASTSRSPCRSPRERRLRLQAVTPAAFMVRLS